MGRVKEWMIEEERVKFERLEAAYLALPEAQIKALDGIQDLLISHKSLIEENSKLQLQLEELRNQFLLQTSTKAKWKERIFSFFLGVIASLVASYGWVEISKLFPVQ